MARPVSKSNELGRATGFNIEITTILERLHRIPVEEWNQALFMPERKGRPTRKIRKLWVVVKAQNGVPVLIDAYRDHRSANRRATFLRNHTLESDQVHLLDIKL